MATVTGIGMGAIGERLAGRDVAIGIVLALSLGLGLLFLHFFTAYATQATALLFGNVLAVDVGTVWTLLWLGVVSTGALAVISRPLLFASLQPELAEAKGVSLRLYSVLFLAIVGLAVAECAQIVRAAGFCADGRTRSGGPGTDQRNPQRAARVGWPCTARSLDRHRAGLLYRLAE